MMSEYARSVQEHYRALWGPAVGEFRLLTGPIHELPVDFFIAAFARSSSTKAYCTVCMSQPGDTQPLELHVLTRANEGEDEGLTELLTVIAHYHRTGAPLALGHSVNFGRPWLRGSICSYGLISLPYLDGPKLEWMESPRVRFLWLIPITKAERQFKKAHGLEALERQFERSQFDYLDPSRPSVVSDGASPAE